MTTSYNTIIKDGLWDNNPGLVQLLGLCPLLAVTGTAINGLGLGLATLMVLVSSNVTVSLIRNLVRPEIRIPAFMMIIACFVTAIELLMNAFMHDLYKILGIFIPLIVTNCSILARAEAFASRNKVSYALTDGFMMGLGFLLVLLAVGSLREILGHGTLFQGAHLMFGPEARQLSITLIEDYRGFLLAILPPGAFLALGLLIALKNIIDNRLAQKTSKVIVAETSAVTAN
ncbi:MAG: electron transport complex subunit E [Gammaproteobacteria bacterium]|nr:electron transport complex subunit E [Gammaproteobacteria bacterium]MDH5592783.1 electron transport complex subunit E [Gammaproteobacteria bacterium]